MEISKNIVLKALAASKNFKFVESDKDVEAYFNQKVYAIKKDSAILKELVKEGKFPIDERLLPLKKGNYHIIDIYEREIEIKSQIKTQSIAYALYREKDSGDFQSRIYRIRINPLTYFISRRLFSDDKNLYNLVGKTICVFSSGKDEKEGYLKVTWEGVEEIEIQANETEYENYLIDEEMLRIAEEEAMYLDYLIDEEIQNMAMDDEMAMLENMDTYQEDIVYGEDYCADILDEGQY